jgi:hypothetical protein
MTILLEELFMTIQNHNADLIPIFQDLFAIRIPSPIFPMTLPQMLGAARKKRAPKLVQDLIVGLELMTTV